MFLGLKENFGASTITQQLIKNLTGYDEVTVKRKIIEIFRALEFDRTHSKEETIEWYLNYIYLGEGCRGVYTAAYTYFGKNVSDLSLAECASLIAITNTPPSIPLRQPRPQQGPAGDHSLHHA
jgi:penicillin-binding protein 1A